MEEDTLIKHPTCEGILPMPSRHLIPRCSLRSLFLATAAIAVATQMIVSARAHSLEARREAFIASIHGSLLASQVTDPAFVERYLNYVERTIAAKDDTFLPPRERQELLRKVAAARSAER
ncbi:hypothetical protein [Anatilimnocola floriformis]|uniref:hypothetical protein n=1 Tax=Anatilimnocola floriformis TaxID=2948575 RepID=UPI0020C3DB38|nr:hypothetical protein [Anatilimnocola floriformis]